MLLEVKGISKKFEKTEAIRDLSFTLNPGEVVGLLGPNGAGKSTCIKCIAGLLRPDAGSIQIAGFVHNSVEAKQKLSYIPETPDPYPLLTTWEHLQFIADAYRIKDWQPYAEQLMERFEMTPNRNKLGKEMSKGMKQKVSMMCGLISQPDLVMMDEPMIGLDPKAIKETREIFKELKAAGKALLISTHLIDSVESVADRIIILKKEYSFMTIPQMVLGEVLIQEMGA